MICIRTILYLDIEVQWEKKEKFNVLMYLATSPIQMIGNYYSHTNKYYSFFFHNDINIIAEEYINEYNLKYKKLIASKLGTNNFNLIVDKFINEASNGNYDCIYLDFNSEIEMLNSYMMFISDISPDIYSGFNIKKFDLVYIINRCKTLRISYSKLSPIRQVYIDHSEAIVKGSIIYDYYDLYSYYIGEHRHAGSLKDVAESHLKNLDGKKITKLSDDILSEDWYDKDINKFKNYCLIDVELCVLLDNSLGLMNRCDRWEKFTGVNPISFNMNSRILDIFILMIKDLYVKEVLHNEYKIALPTKLVFEYESAAGGYVFDSIRGLYSNGLIVIIDFSRMYPNIIKALNISIETLLTIIDNSKKKDYIHSIVNDVYYKKDKIGLIPFIVNFLFILRDDIDKEIKKHPYGSKEYNSVKEVKMTVKGLINSVSSLFDNKYSRFLKLPCANSIRLTGQKEIMTAHDTVCKFSEENKIPIKVIAGDTDSIFLWFQDINDLDLCIKKSEELCERINNELNKLANEMNIDKHGFKIDLEKVMDVFLSTGKKKRYFGHVIWAEGSKVEEKNSLYVMGFESRRSDSSELTEISQKDIFKEICNIRKNGIYKTTNNIIEKIKGYMEMITEENAMKIGIPKRIKKSFDEYKVTNPHIRGCEYMNTYFNAGFDVGSKPKLIYIKNVIGDAYPQTNEICIDSSVKIPKNTFVIDRETMIEKTIIDKFEDVLDVIKLGKSEIFTGYRKTTEEDYMDMLNL